MLSLRKMKRLKFDISLAEVLTALFGLFCYLCRQRWLHWHSLLDDDDDNDNDDDAAVVQSYSMLILSLGGTKYIPGIHSFRLPRLAHIF